MVDAISSWFEFAAERLPELWFRTGEHLVLTGVSTGLAIGIGIPLGVLAASTSWLRSSVLGTIGIFQTIPSLALLAILLAATGKIGAVPAVVALVVYALLPIVRNTVTGIEGVPRDVMEAAKGMGMTSWQQMIKVKIPLAMPIIVAGIRTAAVVGVGIATLSAFIGAGGLGQFINRGLALSDTHLILLGAIPAAALAVIVDAMIAATAWGIKPLRQSQKNWLMSLAKPLALYLPLLLVALGIIAIVVNNKKQDGQSEGTIRIGSKNFTEQLILGELMAQMIEAHTNLTVDRRFNLGGTMICHKALEAGEIDLYAEYTGTGLVTVLNRASISDPELVWQTVETEYRKQFELQWLELFGFDNTYALTVRSSAAHENNWRSVSDLSAAADQLKAGFTAEFSERVDGYPGVSQRYGLRFSQVVDLEPSLMYQAIARGEVDVICAFTTDGRIKANDLQTLTDDKNFFPPYHAASVVTQEMLNKHPVVRTVLDRLTGKIDNTEMQQMNFEVDENNRQPEDVARDFLISKGLVGKSKDSKEN